MDGKFLKWRRRIGEPKNRLAIRHNSVCAHEHCAICGTEMKACIPLALFADGTMDAVCDECGYKYEPELMAALNRFYKY